MPSPNFQIDQPSGAGSGSPGQSRIDLWKSQACNLSALNPPPGATYAWSVLYKPPASTATISSPNAQIASFTPDLNTQSYRLQLVISVSGTPVNTFIFVLSCPKDNAGNTVNRGWRTPAVDEQKTDQNQGGNPNGWDPDYQKIIADLLLNGFGGGGSGTDNSLRMAFGPGTSTSVNNIPAGQVNRVMIDIVTPFTGGSTIEAGKTGSLALIFATGFADSSLGATAVPAFDGPVDVTWATPAQAVVTVAGASAGAGVITFFYGDPTS